MANQGNVISFQLVKQLKMQTRLTTMSISQIRFMTWKKETHEFSHKVQRFEQIREKRVLNEDTKTYESNDRHMTNSLTL